MKRFVYITLSVSLMLTFTACTRTYVEDRAVREFVKNDPDAAGAIKGVRGYNKALITCYTRNDINVLKEYATGRELGKVQHLIEGFVSQGLRMDADLERMRVEKVERWGQNNVMVTTLERWRYRRVYSNTGKEQKPLTAIDYHMSYSMMREDGRTWKVFNLSPV